MLSPNCGHIMEQEPIYSLWDRWSIYYGIMIYDNQRAFGKSSCFKERNARERRGSHTFA